MRVLVLGAGVVGVASAWYLARAGHEVIVIDRQPEPAQETSFANGGQISVSHAEPWANPHTPLKALRWMGREDAPLLFRPRWDLPLFDWSLRFLRECTPARTRANIAAIVGMALHSRGRLKALRRELATQGGLAYDHREQGILHLYTDQAELDAAIAAAAVMRDFGCDRQLKTAAECLAIEPALAGIADRLRGGDYLVDDESGDAMKFTQALAGHCRRVGVEFRFDVTVDAIETGPNGFVAASVSGRQVRADACVVALGSYSPQLVAPLGLHLPIYPAKGYSATIPLGPDSIAPTVSLTDDEHKLVFSRLGERLRVAGTAEFNGYNLELNPVRCRMIVERTLQLFPQLRPAGEPTLWTGLRPATPSNVPIIGRSRIPGLWINSGHGTLGWTMSCGSGHALAELMSGRPAPVDFPFLGA